MENTVSEGTVRKWFSWFKSRIFGYKRERCCKPSTVGDGSYKLISKIESNSTKSITENLKIYHTIVVIHLKALEVFIFFIKQLNL